MTPHVRVVQANILHCLDNPDVHGEQCITYLPQGRLLIDDGYIVQCDSADNVSIPQNASFTDLGDKLITPGFVDTHIHFPQVDIIASYGTQLLDWLERYTFPAEMTFSDPAVAAESAAFFLNELLRNGTTTALVFGTVHPESVDAFFKEAQRRHLRMICGKVMMDRHAPDALLDTPQSSYQHSKTLINRWHGKERLGYAVTPRFAPTSTPGQLLMAKRLLDEHKDVHLHTHMSENLDECRWVSELFPGTQDYLNVYEQFDLVRKRSVFAHSIHLSDSAWQRLAHAEAGVAHCPCSNLFIGSGLFDLKSAQKHQVKLGLGTESAGSG